jgi:hypothetical protein
MGIIKKAAELFAKKIIVPAAKASTTSKTPLLSTIAKSALKTSSVVKTASILTTAAIAGAVYAPSATAKVAKALIPAASIIAPIAILAPKTTKTVFSSPEATKTTVAALINPYAGLVVGLEQGSGLLGTAISKASDTTKAAIVGGLGVATGAGAAYGISSLLESSTGIQGVDSAAGLLGTNDVMSSAGVQTPQTQTLSKSSTTKRKKSRSKALPQQIRQSVRIDINNNHSKRYLNNCCY